MPTSNGIPSIFSSPEMATTYWESRQAFVNEEERRIKEEIASRILIERIRREAEAMIEKEWMANKRQRKANIIKDRETPIAFINSWSDEFFERCYRICREDSIYIRYPP